MRLFRNRFAVPLAVSMLGLGVVVGSGETSAQPPSAPPPEPPAAGTITQRVTFTSPEDPAQVADIVARVGDAVRANPSARMAQQYECFDDRFNGCDAFLAEIVQEGQRTPGGPIEEFGRWRVYITLTTRMQVQQPTGVAMFNATVTPVGEPVPGTLEFNFRQLRPGSNAGELVETWAMPVAQGETFSGMADIDSPPAQVYQDDSDFVYDWVLDSPLAGRSTSNGTEYTSLSIRCDRAQAVNYGYGCVNSRYIPTLEFSPSQFPYISQNVAAHQQYTGEGATWGTPLHRGDPSTNTANRDAACRQDREDKLGTKPTDMENPSCDEYPFASTVEGGGEASVMWVPLAENTLQGQTIVNFYRQNRIMVGDSFYVS